MTSLQAFQTPLLAGGSVLTQVLRKERWRLAQAWRETYACATYSRTGRWRIPNFEWHVFSYGDAPSKSGARAIALYQEESPQVFYAWPEDQGLPMFHCVGGSLPIFTAEDVDVYVFPPDLAWTMAFTHELSMNLGPYFSRREWQPTVDS